MFDAPNIKTMRVILSFLTIAVTAFHFISCQKTGNTPPVIALFSGSGYISADTILPRRSIATFGIKAYKAGVDQLLIGCTIQRSINGAPDSILQQMTLYSQTFSQFYSYSLGDSGNVEQYRFIIRQNNGLTDTASASITVI